MATDEHIDRRLTDVTEVVRSLVETMRMNGLVKVEVEVGDVSIRLRAGNGHGAAAATASTSDVHVVATPPVTGTEPGHVVTAPMIGTYYTSPAPGEPPFVRIGDRVDVGQAIGIIEAMKIMNEIISDCSGTVAEILATNAQPVEYGSPLLRLILDERDE
jgi:acetyl-CoA carboxylase biotin carboxyl carrier protein